MCATKLFKKAICSHLTAVALRFAIIFVAFGCRHVHFDIYIYI